MAGILVAGLLVRLSVLIAYLSTHQWHPQTWEYEEIARNLLDGTGYIYERDGAVFRSFGCPLFPWISYLLHSIGGRDNFIPFFLFHLTLSLGIVWLTFRLAQRLFDRTTALWASMWVALEPGLILYGSYKVHELTLTIFLLLLSLELFWRFQQARRTRYAVLLGLSIGLGILTRPTAVALFPPLLLWAFQERKKTPGTVRSILIVFLSVLLTVLPWALRNSLVYGRFMPISSTWTEAFWRGNNPRSTGSSMTTEGKGILEVAPIGFQNKISAGTEIQRHDLYKQQALQHIVAAPWQFFRRSVERFFTFWWFSPTYGMAYPGIPVLFREYYKVLYGALLVLAVVGWSAGLRAEGTTERRRWCLYLLLLFIGAALQNAFVYVEGRHRLVITPILLVFSAYGARVFLKRPACAH